MSNPYSNLANSVFEDGSNKFGSDSEHILSQSNQKTSLRKITYTHDSDELADDKDSEFKDLDDEPPHDLLISKQDYNKPKETRTDGFNEVSKSKNKDMEESTLISHSGRISELTGDQVSRLSSSGEKELDNDESKTNSLQTSKNAGDLLSDESDDKGSLQQSSHNLSREIQEKQQQAQEYEEEEPIIKNEPITKSKIPLSASMTLQKIPLSTTTILKKLQNETHSSTKTSTSFEPTTTSTSSTSTERITIRCIPIGSAPALHPTIFRISYTQPFSTLIKFITKKLQKLKKDQVVNSVFCYVNSSFAPIPDVSCGELYMAYGVRGELVVNYCEIVAFG